MKILLEQWEKDFSLINLRKYEELLSLYHLSWCWCIQSDPFRDVWPASLHTQEQEWWGFVDSTRQKLRDLVKSDDFGQTGLSTLLSPVKFKFGKRKIETHWITSRRSPSWCITPYGGWCNNVASLSQMSNVVSMMEDRLTKLKQKYSQNGLIKLFPRRRSRARLHWNQSWLEKMLDKVFE